MEFLENKRSWENHPPPPTRKSPNMWTFPSLALYNAPRLHTVDLTLAAFIAIELVLVQQARPKMMASLQIICDCMAATLLQEGIAQATATTLYDTGKKQHFFCINFLGSQSGRNQKFMLENFYVRNSLCFTEKKGPA